jgi:gamma-polyglutamate biosynthesis protein CapA
MKPRTVAFTLGILILFLQLSAIDVTPNIDRVMYGDLSVRVKEKILYFSSALQNTRYVAVSQGKRDSLIFVGDVMLARNVEVLMEREGVDYPYAGLDLRTLASNSAIVGNFEASMATPHRITPAYHMTFSVKEDFIPGLVSSGFTHLSLANNHSLDYGIEGYQVATTKILTQGIESFGHGVLLDSKSISYIDTTTGIIALVAINASASIPTRNDIETVLAEAATKSDVQVIYIHWGTEYDLVHSKTQKLLAKELVDAGADVIVGHHPHVVQDIGIIDGVPVFYSLGNYIFDQYFKEDVMEGLVLSLELSDHPGIYLVPVESKTRLSQPTQMSPTAHAEFLKSLAKRSNPLLRRMIEQGYIPLGDSVATSSKMAIMVQ